MTPGRVTVVTAGHLATCPRMLKAADALAGAGYRVRVVSARFVDWATEADRDLHWARAGAWRWTVVSHDRRHAPLTHLVSGARGRAAESLAAALGPDRAPLGLAARARSRAHAELVRAVLAEPADLVYGGTVGALAVAALAGRRMGVPYALDLEDFHAAEHADDAAGRLANRLAERIEASVLAGAAFLTASSPAIARAYAERYGVHPVTVQNTFPLPPAPPSGPARDPADGLGLYWFSQTIGPGRGLEDAVGAVGLADIRAELTLRGRPAPGYLDALWHLARSVAPGLVIVHAEPAPPDRMVDLCAAHDVGLATESGHVPNRALCLTNKVLTYVVAGLALAVSDTPGQRPLAESLGEGAILYAPGDVEALAAGLATWARDPDALARARARVWRAARLRWHWEHSLERGALVGAVRAALGR